MEKRYVIARTTSWVTTDNAPVVGRSGWNIHSSLVGFADYGLRCARIPTMTDQKLSRGGCWRHLGIGRSAIRRRVWPSNSDALMQFRCFRSRG